MKRITDILEQPRYLAAFVALASLAALSMAWTSQYVFGLDPCQLCYYQRTPYMANVALGLLIFAVAGKNRKAALWLLLIAGQLFVVDALIAAFHAGVEYKWWKGLESCSNYALPQGATIEELKAFLAKREKPIDCAIPAFTLFGISMAGYNFLLAFFLGAATFFFTGRAWRKK